MPRSTRSAFAAAATLLALGPAPPGRAEQADLLRRIEVLEREVRELRGALEEERRSQSPAPAPAPEEPAGTHWSRRVRLSGSANAGYAYGESDSVFSERRFQVSDARIFVDAELGRDLRVGDAALARDAGLGFEWNLVRLGELENDVGSLYAELQGLGDSDWANLRVGRFPIPVGEGYARYGREYWAKPFISHPVGSPWWWDEGVELYGRAPEGGIGYVASLSDGETPFGFDSDPDKQVTLKLFAEPLPWLRLTLSGLRSGRMGSPTRPALGALWLGESFARAFGSGSSVPNWIDGVAMADGPNVLHDSYFGSVDLIAQRSAWGRLWLGYGAYHIDSSGAGLYDRTLHSWVVELLLEGGRVSQLLAPFYAGFRASGLGTYDPGRGYLLDLRYAGTLGYNMRALEAYSTVLGWRLSRWLSLRTEYTHQRIDLVRGAGPTLSWATDDVDFGAIEIGAHF